MVMSFRIINMAGFFTLLKLIDRGPGEGVSVLGALMNGDIEHSFNLLGGHLEQLVIRPEGRKSLITTMVTLGLIRQVANLTGVAKKFSFGNFEVGL